MVSFPSWSGDSVLFVTLDSCRYDSFEQAAAPLIKAVGPLHQAQAPSYFTYGSHAAMFVGFTPGVASAAAPFLNPKYGKLFKVAGMGFPSKGREGYVLHGSSIVDGFKRAGFRTVGAAAMGWFNPATPTGQHLTRDFEEFAFVGRRGVQEQVDFLLAATAKASPVFAFINVGETHVPYWHHGASWSREDNPCVPFQLEDRSADCRYRQVRCLEYVDTCLAPLLDRFSQSTIIVCSDHGDCWGEDGIWEHGVSHWATLTVPLVMRVRGVPVGPEATDTQGDVTYVRVGEAKGLSL